MATITKDTQGLESLPEGAKELLDDVFMGVLATANEDGSPWATPLHLFYGEGQLYWFSKDTAQHSQNVIRQPRVSAALFSPNRQLGLRGVYVSGLARVAKENEHEKALALVEARLGVLPDNFRLATVFSLPIGKLDAQKSSANCWYFYT